MKIVLRTCKDQHFKCKQVREYDTFVYQRTSTLLLIAIYFLFYNYFTNLCLAHNLYFTIGNTLPTFSKLTYTVHLVFLKQC